MIDDLVRHLQALAKVESLIAHTRLSLAARRLVLLTLAGLIAVFGLGMADLAAFFELQISLGNVWAAAIVALADFAIAGALALYAASTKPGPEMQLALEVRALAINSLQDDARELEAGARAVSQQIREVKDTISGFVSSPFDAAARRLLLPAVIGIIRGLRTRHDKTDPAPGT
jgi:hypothetical protein